jgi:hypothetical protein
VAIHEDHPARGHSPVRFCPAGVPYALPAAKLGYWSNTASRSGNFGGLSVEFITTYVLPPIFLGFLVSLGIIGFRNLRQRMSGGKSAESAPSRPDEP